MAVYHRTQRLQIYGEKPEVTKLFGDRYRMVVRCKAARDTEAWYNANKDQIFASFGTLYSAQMSVDGIDPRVGEAYPDMCLVSNSASYTQTGEYVITFVYETLTATWTKEQDDEVTSTDNGLRVLERSEVAKVDGFPIVQLSGLNFNTSKVVLSGMGNASNYFVLLVKANSANTIYWRATNEALATQTGSFTTASTDQWEYKVIYTPISIDQLEIGYDGTNYSTFDLSEFYVVSQSSDWQNNIVESFINFEVTVDNPSSFTDTVVFTGSNGNTATGTNVQGGGTGSVSSPYDEDDVGVATITDGGKTLYLASFQDQTGADNDAQVGRVVTRWAEAGILSRTEDFVGSQDSLVIEAIGPDPSTPSGFSLASKQESNYEGFQTNRFTFLKDDVQLSQTEDKVGSQLAISQQWFNPSADKTLAGYSLASKNISDFEGIETVEYRFLKNNVELSRSEDLVGSQLAITTQVFNPTSDPTEAGYSLARKEESDIEGIPTKRYTFLKPSVLSVQQDFNNGLKRVLVQAFNLDSAAVSAALSEVTVDHKLIATNENDYEGIKTTTFQYQIDESFTEDYELNGLKRISLIELSATNFSAQVIGGLAGESATPPAEDPPNVVPEGSPIIGLYLGTQDIDNGGLIKVRESVWLEAGTLSVSKRNLSEGVVEVTTVFLGAEGATVGPVIARSTSEFQGLQTISVTTLQDADGNSIVDGGTNLVHQYKSFKPFQYAGVINIEATTGTTTNGNQYVNITEDIQRPPAQAQVLATTYVFFQTASDLIQADYTYGSSSGFWSPNNWASSDVSISASGYSGFKISKGYRGYRTSSENASGTVTQNLAAFPFAQYNNSTKIGGFDISISYSISLEKGPPDPIGSKWVISADITPAFDDVSGTTYYKKTLVVTDTIPTQSANAVIPYN